MKKLLVLLLLSATPAFSQSVQYTVGMPDPSSHLFHIAMTIDDPGTASVDLGLPAWNATYVIRDFAQYLQAFDASVDFKRIDKQTWRLEPNGTDRIEVRYTIYADQASPFSSQLNESHAFFNSANLLLLWKQQRDLPLVLVIEPARNWTIATALPETEYRNVYRADNYDHLVDSPVDVGNLDRHRFTVNGIPIHIVVDGAHRDYDADELVSVLRRVVQGHVDLMQDVPFEQYYFLYHFTRERSGGGMEHRDSTAINRTFGAGDTSVRGIVGVSSHEFFHLWNVKRIRPRNMEPIDYFAEDYSTALWFNEGFTSYYGGLVLTRIEYQTRQEYYRSLARQVRTLQSRPGRHELSAADTSLLTWFDGSFFNQAENSFSYYNKGLLIGLLLDLKIRDATDNRFSMDDVMRHLNENYAQQGRYFEDDFGIAVAITEVTGLDLDEEYADFVHRRTELPYQEYLGFAGLELIEPSAEVQDERLEYEIREIENATPKQRRIRDSWLSGN